MTSDPSKEIKSIKVNGLEIKTLKGGFMAYHRIRTGHERTTGDGRNKPSPPPLDPPQYLLCKKCGTVINVYPPGRLAKCCNQEMVSIDEIPSRPPLKQKEKENESSGTAGP